MSVSGLVGRTDTIFQRGEEVPHPLLFGTWTKIVYLSLALMKFVKSNSKSLHKCINVYWETSSKDENVNCNLCSSIKATHL